MNEIKILKEIAYYSKFIDQQKKQMWNYNYNINNKYVAKSQNPYNKYKYVKEETTVIAPVQNEIVNKVLINPNFKKTVLINPHFNVQNREIHVNPKVLNTQLPICSYKPIIKEPKQDVLPHSYFKQNILPKHTEQCISNSKLSPRKRRVSIRSKYKIVKSSCINTPTKILNSSKYPTIKNKYKIDRRSINNRNKPVMKKKVVIHGISDMLRHNVFKNKTWKKSLLINQFKSHNTRLTNISGILYKKTQTKLQKIQPASSNAKQKKSLVVIKGQKYTIGKNKKSLKLVSSFSKMNKSVKKTTTKLIKYKQLSNKFVKSNQLSLNNSRKLKKMSVIQARNKLRINNQPCPVYRRYGKCRRKESGRCYFLHNPNQIFLCKKFLQGACIDKECLLSHKVSLEKMPTCKYFLEGCCVRNDCSYLHVKINPKADICRKFLEGFCEKGSQCNLRHQFLCPAFERNGSCPKRKCMYPHKSKVEVVEKPKMKVHLEKKDIGPQEQPAESARYYVDNVDIGVKHDEQVNVIDNDTNSDLCSSDSDERPLRRPRLGTLPSFIPFN